MSASSSHPLRGAEVTALLVAPDRELAARWYEASSGRTFQILADLPRYPSPAVLELRLRQLRPAALLLDLASDAEAAFGVIRAAASQNPPAVVVGLDYRCRPEVVTTALRLGACEFLAVPFSSGELERAAMAVRRLAGMKEGGEPEMGKVIGFSSAKPGAGASALASQFAFTLARHTGRKILLADLDPAGGTVAFYTGLEHNYSFFDLMEMGAEADPAAVGALAASKAGVDILPAPAVPRRPPEDPVRMRVALDQLRRVYEWTVLDLPCIFDRTSLLVLAETDLTFLVATPEVAGLHLARKAVQLLHQAGAGPDRIEVILNRAGGDGGLPPAEVGRILGRSLETVLPEDHGAIYAAAATGTTLREDSPLASALSRLAERLAGASPVETRNGRVRLEPGTVFAQT